jgi:hypothetical protein
MGEPRIPAISDGRIKIPEPITVPATMEVAVNNPICLLRVGWFTVEE